jgi:hypothetical protein
MLGRAAVRPAPTPILLPDATREMLRFFRDHPAVERDREAADCASPR